MYTIEDAKLSPPNSAYHIPEGPMREYDHEDIIRALESDVQTAHDQNMTLFRRFVSNLRRKLTGSTADQTRSDGRGLPA